MSNIDIVFDAPGGYYRIVRGQAWRAGDWPYREIIEKIALCLPNADIRVSIPSGLGMTQRVGVIVDPMFKSKAVLLKARCMEQRWWQHFVPWLKGVKQFDIRDHPWIVDEFITLCRQVVL